FGEQLALACKVALDLQSYRETRHVSERWLTLFRIFCSSGLVLASLPSTMLFDNFSTQSSCRNSHADGSSNNQHNCHAPEHAEGLIKEQPSDECGKYRLQTERDGKPISRQPAQGCHLE